MAIGALSPADKEKIKNLLNDGVQTLMEVATLKEGLKDAVTTIAEELEIKPAVLNRAIRTKYKSNLNRDEIKDTRDILDDIEELIILSEK